jgi:malate dehydrogenase (oxaloacetate-decarboxylating)(NADP+)
MLKGAANLLIMPNLDAANIALNLLTTLGDGQAIGPMLMGTQLPAHIVTPSTTVRGLLNMTAIAVYDAQITALYGDQVSAVYGDTALSGGPGL